jgi:hypothetical protein
LWVEHLVVAHSANAGQMQSEVRLAGAMAGLFASGLAAVIAGFTVFWRR